MANTKYRITAEQIRLLVVEQGLDFQKAANILGVSRPAVAYWAKAYGFASPLSKSEPRPKPQVGQRFRHYVVIDATPKQSDRGWETYTCQCDCGEVRDVFLTQLHTGTSSTCKRCSTPHRGIGVFPKREWGQVLSSAKSRGIKVTISMEDAYAVFLEQGGRCALTGWEINFHAKIRDRKRRPGTASLDRIDSSRGYEEGNIQWVHKDVNLMKNTLSQDRFVKICKAVSRHFSNARKTSDSRQLSEFTADTRTHPQGQLF